MSQRQRTNWLLSGIVLLLLFAAYREFHNPQVNLQSLLELQPKDIRQIEIRRPDAESILLERSADHWQMKRPDVAVADDQRIKALLSIAGAPVYRRFALATSDPGVFGLKPPRVSLWLNRIRIDFGATEPINHRRYVQVNDQVSLIDDSFQHHLLAPLSSFIRSDNAID